MSELTKNRISGRWEMLFISGLQGVPWFHSFVQVTQFYCSQVAPIADCGVQITSS